MLTRQLLAVLVLVGSITPFLCAQDPDDPLVREFERYVEAAGGQSRLQGDDEYQRSRAGWKEAAKEISAAIEQQDEALAKNKAAVEQAITLYSSRAASRGKAVDHYLLGRMLGLAGHLDEAYRSFTQALQVDRYFFWAWDGLGVYHSNKGNWVEARNKFDRVLQLNKGYLKSSFGRAQCLFRMGDIPAAAIQLREILDKPENREDPLILRQTRLLLAEIYRSEKDYPAAIRELNALESEGMKDIRVYVMRAWCHRQLERWAEAVKDYDAIMALEPGEVRYELHKAACLISLGRNADAIASFERYLREGGDQVSPEEKISIVGEVERLKDRPAVEDPKSKAQSFQDLCNTALHSPHADKRLEAVIILSHQSAEGNPKINDLLRSTFANALKDNDPRVQAKALEQMNRRYWDPVHLLNVTKMLTKLKHSPNRLVRGMAAHSLVQYDHRETVPVLIEAMQEEAALLSGRADPDFYVFRRIHETLNAQTLAWIGRVLPDDLEARDVQDIADQWVAWYKKKRDIYRRTEPQGFKLVEPEKKNK